MLKKIILLSILFAASTSSLAVEYHGFVRGLNLNESGLMQLSMSSDIHTAPQCAGPFGVTQFQFTIDHTNAHIASNWLPLIEAARQAKQGQEGATSLPHAATDPATIKVGYTVDPNNICKINYIYYLHWYNL